MVSDVIGSRERFLRQLSRLIFLTFLSGLQQSSVALAQLAGILTDVDVLCSNLAFF